MVLNDVIKIMSLYMKDKNFKMIRILTKFFKKLMV
jgi:hypothetical protein